MRERKRALCRLLLCAALAAGMAAGCGEKAQETEGGTVQEEAAVQIGLSFDSFVIERWMRDRDIIVSTAKELGAEVNVQNANGDVGEQISQIEYFIKKQMDVIVVVAGDCEALTDVMVRAREAGIRTVCYDRLVQNAGCDLYISFDNREVGRLMARIVREAMPEGGDIFLILGPLSDHNVSMVRQGIEEELAGSGLHVAYEQYCEGWLAENAYAYAKEALRQNREVKAILCGNDDLASQAFRALAEERLAGRVLLSGQDGDLAACQRIVEGTQRMTAFKDIEEEARLVAEHAVRLAQGDAGEDGEAMGTIYDGAYQVPCLELEPIAVTRENMDDVIIKGGFHAREDVYLNME